MKIVFTDLNRCFGCGHCESVCSIRQCGDVSKGDSGIQLFVDFDLKIIATSTCHQCEIPHCLHACPAHALSKDPVTHAVVVDKRRCVGCRMCVYACPHGAMHFIQSSHIAFKCDLCQGDPICVKACMARALFFVDSDDMCAFVQGGPAAMVKKSVPEEGSR